MLVLRERAGRLYAHGVIDGKRVRRSLGLSTRQLGEAKERLKGLEAELRAGQNWSEAARRYLTRPEGVSRGTQGYVSRLTRYWGTTPLDQITDADILRFIEKTQAGNTPGAIRRCLVVFKAVLNHVNLQPLPRFPPIVVDDARTRWLSQAEVNRLLDRTRRDRPELLPLIRFLLSTGCRVGEALRLDWRDVDLEGGTVTLLSKKGRRTRVRTVPLSATAAELLTPLRKDKGPVFQRSYFGVRKAFLAVAEDAGLHDVRLHDLRRTFASHLFLAGADLISVAKLMGHEDLSMLKKVYAQVTGAHLGAVIAKLPY